MTRGQGGAHLDPPHATDRQWASDALEDHWTGLARVDDPHEGGTHLLDVVAAVDHLARGLRHDFTVWDALDEALDWWLIEQTANAHGAIEDPASASGRDPLSEHTGQLLELIADDPDTTLAEALQQAIRRWATTMAERFNNGHHWPDPTPRRGFPPRLVNP